MFFSLICFAADPATADDSAGDPPQARFAINGVEELNEDLHFLETVEPNVALAWETVNDTPGEAVVFEVQWARDPGFPADDVWYRGRDRASFVAGLAEGDYFFRVRAESEAEESGPWSPVLQVNVEYQSLKLAWTLFGIGSIVFLATVVLIVAGNAQSQRESREHT
ncbi:MAG: hypothetical protein WD490_03650 [Opitutales bacterium]